METVGNKRIKDICVLLCIFIFAICYFYIAYEYFKFDVKNILLFLSIVILSIQVPGLAFLNLCGLKFKSRAADLSIGFFLGFAFLTFIYYISVWIDSKAVIYIYMVLSCFASLLIFIKGRKKYDYGNIRRTYRDHIDYKFIFSVMLIFCGCIVYLQFKQVPIQTAESTNIMSDLVWHMGITDAVAKDFFPIAPWSGLDIELKYHYFMDLLYGIILRISGIPADIQILQCSSFLLTYVFSISSYAFFKEILKKNKSAAIFAVCIFLTIFAKTNFIDHVLSNTNNVGMALSCSMCIAVVLNAGLKRETNWKTACLVIFLLSYIFTGLKAPFAIVLVCAMIGTLLLAVILRYKNSKRLAIYTFAATIAFVFTYKIFIASSSGNSRGAEITLGATMKYSFLSDIYYNIISEGGAVQYLKYVIILIFVAVVMGACFLPFIAGFFGEANRVLIKKEEMDPVIILQFAMVIVGFSAWLLLDFHSNNQMYFAFAAAPSLVMIGAWYFTRIEWKQKWLSEKFICCFSALMLIVSVSLIGKSTLSYIAADCTEYTYATDDDYEDDTERFSHCEYLGMLWLRDNTDEEDLIASDRQSLDMSTYDTKDRFKSRWFYTVERCVRQFFFEGTGYAGVRSSEQREELYKKNRELYDSLNENRAETAEKLGVDYIVVSKRINPQLEINENGIACVYSNKDIDIYEVKDGKI